MLLLTFCIKKCILGNRKTKMQRTSKRKMQAIIEELYFEKLEDNLVDFTYLEDIGNGQSQSFVKDEYLESVENMIDYIWGLDTWVGKWTLELYLTAKDEEETIDTQTEYGVRKLSNKKGGFLL